MRVHFICAEAVTRGRDVMEKAVNRNGDPRFEAIFKAEPECVKVLDGAGRILQMNPAGLGILEAKSSEEVIGRNMFDFVAPAQHEEVRQCFSKVFKRENVTCAFEVIGLHGSRHWVESHMVAMQVNGDPVEVLAVTRDITKERQAEKALRASQERLQQAQKMEALGTLAGGIAHDFNNILAAIIGYAELARMSVPADNSACEAIDETIKAAGRATDLVRQILTFSRQQEHERKVIQLTPIVCEAGKLLRAALPASVEIRTIIASGLPNVLADATQIHQVLMNLGANAAHAMRRQGGVLEIVFGKILVSEKNARANIGLNPGMYLRIIVRDTGEGMRPEVIQRIYEPFFTTKPVGEGTGLGLAVVHGIIKAHDGAISVSSQPGMGSSFEIYLPAVEDGAVSSGGGREIPQGNGEKILYVDDEVALCRLVEHSLERCGYVGVTRADPVEALRVFIENPNSFAGVITDFTMPKMSGLELAAEIRKIAPEMPVVITTGYSGSLDAEALKLSGVKDVLAKPFTMQRLAETLHGVLNGA
jgi:PAS domain S-box-containing protein